MKVQRVEGGNSALLEFDAEVWSGAEVKTFDMVPTPVVMVQEVSPFLAISENHGTVQRLDVAAIHNGSTLAIRLKWASEKHDKIQDLNAFADGVAVLFPVARGALAVTMGAKGKPVNAWYWKASTPTPYEVVAEGFSAVNRLKDKAGSDLRGVARHNDGHWSVILRRSLVAGSGLVKLQPGGSTKVAFAAWNGGNAERSGRKSFSGEFMDLEIQK